MTTTIDCLLIRHGSTIGNEEKRYTGCRTDETLSEKGIAECRELSELFSIKALESDTIVVSGVLKRCMQSAGIIFPDITPVIDTTITEIDFGDFEGRNYEELKNDAVYNRWLASGGTLPFPKGESRDDFIKRSFDSFKRCILRLTGKSKKIAFVCHGGNIMSVMSCLTNEDYFDFQTRCCEGYRLVLETDTEVGKDEIALLSYDSLLRREHP